MVAECPSVASCEGGQLVAMTAERRKYEEVEKASKILHSET